MPFEAEKELGRQASDGSAAGGYSSEQASPACGTWMDGEAEQGLVSVIMPGFNRADLILHPLSSVARQSYRPIELIVVDDGSTDGTAGIVEEWGRRAAAPGLTVRLIRKPNGGAPSARNVGLRASRGEFIQFLDSDDALVRRKIEAQVRALRSDEDVLFAWSDFAPTADPADFIRYDDDPGEWAFSKARPQDTPPQIWRGLFRRRVCKIIGPWNEELKRFQDWEYCIRYIALNPPSLRSSNIGYVSLYHQDGRINDLARDYKRNVDCYFAAALSASAAIKDRPTLGARLRISQLYSQALLSALREGDLPVARLAMSRIRSLVPKTHPVYLKNEGVYQLFKLVGHERASRLSTMITSRRSPKFSG